MNIHRKIKGFMFNYRKEDNPSIYINTNKLDKCIKYIQKNKILSIIINEQFDFNLDNLDFLYEIDFIEKIEIEPCNLKNDSALNCLKNLKYLSCSTNKSFRKKIDFLNFKELEFCNITYNNNILNLDNCLTLNILHIWGLKESNLEIVSRLENIEELSVNYSNLTNLQGIENLKKLKNLTIEYSPKLCDISNLTSNKNTLKILAFRNCKSIKNYDVIGDLIYLERMDCVNAGETKSVDFFKKLKNIKYCYFTVNVLDGDVSPLMDKLVIFKNYKHYNHKNNLKMKYSKNGSYFERNKEKL